jgi:hypothetical protein
LEEVSLAFVWWGFVWLAFFKKMTQARELFLDGMLLAAREFFCSPGRVVRLGVVGFEGLFYIIVVI